MELITFIIYISIYIGLIATTFYILTYRADEKQELQYAEKELPKVSVLIPACNEESSIKRTIESILKSDYPKNKFEVIVINNNSTDNTLKIAKQLAKNSNPPVRVLTELKQGKGCALNLGISKAKGEIIFTMDADTSVHPKTMKKMVRYFKDLEVYSVTPGMIIDKPKNLLQRIQYTEYLLGLFLRKTFSLLNSIYITPGAFSAYRVKFFKKHGGYDENNITEDLEISLRIQFNGYKIANVPDAPAYTIAPNKFSHLLNQRKRWYIGLIKNTWRYRKLMSPRYGDMGMFVMPIAWISILFAVLITTYLFIDTLINVKDELLFLQNINYDFPNLITLNLFFFERLFFKLATNTILIFVLIFITVLGIYLYYARKKVGRLHTPFFNLVLFFIFFAVLFGFWWIISIIYIIFNKGIKWK